MFASGTKLARQNDFLQPVGSAPTDLQRESDAERAGQERHDLSTSGVHSGRSTPTNPSEHSHPSGSQVDACQARIEELEKEKVEMQQGLEEQREMSLRQRQLVRELKNQLVAVRTVFHEEQSTSQSEDQGRLAQLEQERAELVTTCEEGERRTARLEQELAQTRTAFEEQRGRRRARSIQLEKVQAEALELKQSNRNINMEKQTAARELGAAQQRLKCLRRDLSQTREEKQRTERENASKSACEVAAKTSLKHAQSELTESRQMMSVIHENFGQQLQDVKDARDMYKADLLATKKLLQESQRCCQQASEQRSAIQQNNFRLEEELEDERERVKTLQEGLAEIRERQQADAQAMREGYEEKLQKLMRSQTRTEGQLAGALAGMQEAQDEAQQLRVELEGVQEVTNVISAREQVNKKENENFIAQVLKQAHGIRDERNANEALRRQVRNLGRENGELKLQMTKLRSSAEAAETPENRALRAENDDMREECERLQRELEDARGAECPEEPHTVIEQTTTGTRSDCTETERLESTVPAVSTNLSDAGSVDQTVSHSSSLIFTVSQEGSVDRRSKFGSVSCTDSPMHPRRSAARQRIVHRHVFEASSDGPIQFEASSDGPIQLPDIPTPAISVGTRSVASSSSLGEPSWRMGLQNRLNERHGRWPRLMMADLERTSPRRDITSYAELQRQLSLCFSQLVATKEENELLRAQVQEKREEDGKAEIVQQLRDQVKKLREASSANMQVTSMNQDELQRAESIIAKLQTQIEAQREELTRELGATRQTLAKYKREAEQQILQSAVDYMVGRTETDEALRQLSVAESELERVLVELHGARETVHRSQDTQREAEDARNLAFLLLLATYLNQIESPQEMNTERKDKSQRVTPSASRHRAGRRVRSRLDPSTPITIDASVYSRDCKPDSQLSPRARSQPAPITRSRCEARVPTPTRPFEEHNPREHPRRAPPSPESPPRYKVPTAEHTVLNDDGLQVYVLPDAGKAEIAYTLNSGDTFVIVDSKEDSEWIEVTEPSKGWVLEEMFEGAVQADIYQGHPFWR